MILVDISQIAIANIMMSPDISKNKLDENLIKHMILTSLMLLKSKFGKEYGSLVICCDGKRSWRKDAFEHYKATRKKDKDDSFIDWTTLYATIENFKRDLKAFFPYKVIQLDSAEADDVIAILAKNSQLEKSIIISSDKDFAQLQIYPSINQYCPRKKKLILIKDPKAALTDLVIRGDRGDGVPNIRSDSDTFVNKDKRQAPINEKFLAKCALGIPEELTENYRRNDMLINFANIPEKVESSIMLAFHEPANGSKQTMYNYFIKNQMKNLLLEIGKF